MQALLGLCGRPGLSVLAYHRVIAEPDRMRPGEFTVEEFEARMRWVAANFQILRLWEAARALREDRLPRRTLCITFDDGYADNHNLALPVLRQLGLSATFFIATGYLDGGWMFNDAVIEALRAAPGPTLDLGNLGLGRLAITNNEERRQAADKILEQLKYELPKRRDEVARELATRAGAALPARLMMTSAQVKALHEAGMDVGAHTVTHPILARISFDRARKEIVEGRTRLQQIIRAPVRVFAYPNGRPRRDYRREHARLAQELGFEAAVSTAWGVARPGGDLYQIPRFTPWDRPNWRFGLRLLRNLYLNPDLA